MEYDLKVLLVYHSTEIPENEVKLLTPFRRVCREVHLLFTENTISYKPTLWQRFRHKIKWPVDRFAINKRLRVWALTHKPDLIFIVKGELIHPSTLRYLKSLNCRLVSWSNDDMYAWHNRSWFYTRGLRHYDLVVTQKSYNARPEELPALGARQVLFQDKSYDPALHFPCDAAYPDLQHAVLFIGTFEKYRFESLLFLAQNEVKVNIYGWGRRENAAHPNLVFHDCYLYGKDFRCAITQAKICLNFLRKLNRDRQTSRSVEIPACGGFMLAERTDEHQALFAEGLEAEYFGDNAELLSKVRRYLHDEDLRQKIARAGYRRCLESGYSFENRLRQIVETVYGS